MSALLLVEYGEVVASEAKLDSNGTRLEISLEDLQTLRTHSRQLEASINNLKHSDQLLSSNLQDIHRAEEASSLLSSHIDKLWHLIPIRSKPTAGSAVVATKVFAVPELLEIILMLLPAKIILNAQQVGRVWRDAVNGSVMLKTKLGLIVNSSLAPQTPFSCENEADCFPGLIITIDRDWEPFASLDMDVMEEETNNELTIVGSCTLVPPSVGTRCRSMQLCQPPLKAVCLSTGARGTGTGSMGRRPPTYTQTLDCGEESGVTVGSLLDAINSEPILRLAQEIRIEGFAKLNSEHPIMEERSIAYESAKKRAAAKERRRAKRRARSEALDPNGGYWSSDDYSDSDRSDSDIDA
ncbi:hypothetical protein Slin14017_G085530 [Septoria linicola]|nr:hypothetical protein Slin14017_G085530 [Septoria linicola]